MLSPGQGAMDDPDLEGVQPRVDEERHWPRHLAGQVASVRSSRA